MTAEPGGPDPSPELVPGVVPVVWGIAVASSPARCARVTARWVRRGVAAAVVTVTVLLGVAGTVMASTSSAHADILGVSDTVQDWICGVVSPDEPWQGVGDGPESWMSNRNLAGARQIPAASSADPSSGQMFTPAQQGAVVVPDTMDQLPALPPGEYTLYEIAGLRGLSWWTIPLNTDGTRNCSLWNYVWSQTGNLIFTINKTLLQVTIAIKEAAAADDPLKFLYDESSGAISTVFAVFFVPIASLMLILAGIWAGITALRKSGIRAALGAAGIAACIIALAGFLYSVVDNQGTNGFRSVAGTVDRGISEVNAVATNALFDGLAQESGACALPAGPASAIRGQRITSCVLADALAYRPWAIGQFGGAGANPIPLPADWTVTPPNAQGSIPIESLREEKTLPCYVDFADCKDLRSYLIAQHGGVQIGERLSGGNGYIRCSADAVQQLSTSPAWMAIKAATTGSGASSEPLTIAVSAACSPMYRVFAALKESNPTTAQAYAGAVGIARVGQAFSALIGTLVAGVAVLITGLITMSWIALTFALYVTGLFKLAFATYSGKAKMAKEWAGDLVHAWAARLAYGIVLSITILIIAWMLGSTMSFGLRLVWLGVILFFFWKLVQKVQDMIRPGVASIAPDLAGDVQRRTTRTARGVSRQAVRSTVGAGAGMLVAGQRRRLMSADPSRGPVRRTVGTMITPVAVLAGGVRGAVAGPEDAQRRAWRTLSRTSARQTIAAAKTPEKKKTPASPPAGTGNTLPARVAGGRNFTAVDARTTGRTPIRGGASTGAGVHTAGTRHPNAVDPRTPGRAPAAGTVGPVLPRRPPPTGADPNTTAVNDRRPPPDPRSRPHDVDHDPALARDARRYERANDLREFLLREGGTGNEQLEQELRELDRQQPHDQVNST